ncbi:PH domain-containing protein [Heyndrickxia oleronia]|uniref:PH domain-containing protein n=1 Tax=Heyndrickxia oleronia TaxID=38875 RepID=UPI00071710F5|nr:PH domain-containing protein [Heyndrickxia oleronia]OJH19467.1 hypothetical protein BLX88_09815 [Bacillus obstructivus]MBU5210338.1 PH domain-containing protein [Heyndrickxia oleronia]MCI1590763.1 PH domain-containing protein [Heyndrickxia oleronia]MCI1612048.1 PH domain-containing protein [Heyndrickxia oleronia]MCI1759757.1 PH domain-containing protein [Heyndrickxia oleronia]
MRYYSKKGPILSLIVWALVITLIGTMIFLLFHGLNDSDTLFEFIVIAIACVLIIWLWMNTYYEITNKGLLKVVTGPFHYTSIEIKGIKSITKTRNFISSPALSMDRIEIQYNKWHSIIISPKDKNQFINQLMELNPDINVDDAYTNKEKINII